MVGGFIVQILDVGEVLWVNCQGTGSEQRERCAVYCSKTPEAEHMKLGDSFWWQSGYCYWTPADRSQVDVAIPKRSGSGVRRPQVYQTVA